MADVRLDFYDLDADDLPDVCMKCGAPSSVRPVKTFAWVPVWARFTPWWIQVSVTKRRRVPVPLCDQHKHHWTIRILVGLGGLAVFLPLLICGGVMFGSNVDADPHGPLTILGVLIMALAGIAFLAWLVGLIALSVTAINVIEVTDETITLRNVSPAFTQAYRDMTRGDVPPDVERAAREQFRRPGGRPPRQRPDDYPPDDKYRRR
jgi:hypothetical protein